MLDTTPIDPQSLFSGDYVRLNYKISRLSLEQIGGDRGFRQHDTIYVLLRRSEPVRDVVSVHKTDLTPSAEHVILRGEVVESGMHSWNR